MRGFINKRNLFHSHTLSHTRIQTYLFNNKYKKKRQKSNENHLIPTRELMSFNGEEIGELN